MGPDWMDNFLIDWALASENPTHSVLFSFIDEHTGQGFTEEANCYCLTFDCLLANIVIALLVMIVGGGGF